MSKMPFGMHNRFHFGHWRTFHEENSKTNILKCDFIYFPQRLTSGLDGKLASSCHTRDGYFNPIFVFLLASLETFRFSSSIMKLLLRKLDLSSAQRDKLLHWIKFNTEIRKDLENVARPLNLSSRHMVPHYGHGMGLAGQNVNADMEENEMTVS